MMIRSTMSAALIVCAAGAAHAQSIPILVFENGNDIAVQGLSINLEIVDLGDQVEMVMRNNSTMDSRVTTIYFELTEFGVAALSSPVIMNNSDSSYTSSKVAPGSPAGSIQHFGGKWGGTMFGLAPEKPGPNVNALNPGEEVSVVFDLGAGYTAADVFDAINKQDSDMRVAIHIQSVGDSGSSVWGVSPVPDIPTPGVAALMGLGGLMASRRRRTAA